MTTAGAILYTARVEVTGGRGGAATSASGALDVPLARPADRGAEAGTDPEELFAAGYAACFDSALSGAARRRNVRLGPTTTMAAVSLHATAAREYSISIALEVRAPDCPLDVLRELVDLADTMCPYSKAIRGNVPVVLSAVGRD